MLTFLEGLNCIMMDRTSYQQLTSSCLSSFFTHHLEGSRIPGLPNSRTDDGDVSTCPPPEPSSMQLLPCQRLSFGYLPKKDLYTYSDRTTGKMFDSSGEGRRGRQHSETGDGDADVTSHILYNV